MAQPCSLTPRGAGVLLCGVAFLGTMTHRSQWDFRRRFAQPMEKIGI
ncbi:unnamed protein product [Ixodes pacificus]